MHTTGDFVFDTIEKANVQVLEKIEAWGYISYKVFNPATGRVYKANEEQLSSSGSTMQYDENYLRYVTLLSKIKNETAGGFLSSLASGIIPLPHQLHVLNRAMETNNIRYILADEVGLGKTIEAGMIIRELKSRGLVSRILVVCPTGLVTQWASEMQEKFHEKFQVILPSDYDTIRRLTDNDDVYGQFDQVISPMDSIKPIEKHAGWSEEKVEKYNEERIYSIINSGWDLIIIDEAHRVAGSSGEVARYKLGNLLAQASPYLLLLSATPHNGKTEPFLRLIRLLDADAFPNAKSIVREQVAPYLIRTEKREAIDNNGNLLFKNRITHLVTISWDERNNLQRELYEMVSSYVSETYNKALRNRKKNMCLIFLLIIMQRMVTSSTAAIQQSLERRLSVLKEQRTCVGNLKEEDLDELNIEDGVEEAIEAISLDMDLEIEELQQIVSLAKQAQFQNRDAKVEPLIMEIDAILSADRSQKIIIFTEFVATQKYLQELLVNIGYSVTILNGGMSIDELYLRDLYECALNQAKSVDDYRAWFELAEKKATIDVTAAEHNVDIDTSELNRAFCAYAMKNFGKLSSEINLESPVMVSSVMDYIHDHSEKAAIIVMDGMSEFDWTILKRSFAGICYRQSAAFAMIPSTTSISRQCLLSGKYPSQLIEPWKQSKEKNEFYECARKYGYKDNQIGYERGYDASFSAFVKCGAVIILDIDELVHAQYQGRIGMLNDDTVLMKQNKLAELTKRLLQDGFDVYITADHGNTPCTGLGRLTGSGVEVETRSHKMVVLKDFANKDSLIERYGLLEYPKYYLPKDYDYLICNVGDSLDIKGENVMTHGGISLDEVVVPFIIARTEDYHG